MLSSKPNFGWDTKCGGEKKRLKKETKNINERRTRKKIKLSKTNATKRERAKKKKVVLTVLKLTSELMLWCCEKNKIECLAREYELVTSLEPRDISPPAGLTLNSCNLYIPLNWTAILVIELFIFLPIVIFAPQLPTSSTPSLRFTAIEFHWKILISSTFCPWSNWMLYHLSQQHFTFLHSFLFYFASSVQFQASSSFFNWKEEKKSVVHVSSETQTCSGSEMRWIHKIVTQWIYYTLQRRSVMLSSASCCFLYWIIALEQALLSFNISFTSRLSLLCFFFVSFTAEEKKKNHSFRAMSAHYSCLFIKCSTKKNLDDSLRWLMFDCLRLSE